MKRAVFFLILIFLLFLGYARAGSAAYQESVKAHATPVKTAGSPDEKKRDTSPKTTGSLSFSVLWRPAPRSPDVPGQAVSCSSAGISSIDAAAYGPSSQKIASGGPWTCSDHIGLLEGIPAGVKIRLIVTGRNSSGDVWYRGERKGITIKAGQTESAGKVTAVPVAPSLHAPENDTSFANGPENTTAKGFINGGAAKTNSTVVTLDISAVKKDGVVAYHVSEWAKTPGVDEPIWVAIPPTESFSARIPYTLSSEDGKKTVYVRFKDSLGNISREQSDTIALDTRPPTTRITSRPPGLTKQTSAKFSFTSSEGGAKFLCTLDGVPSECSTRTSYEGLQAGPHTVTVAATDEAGNTDPKPASYTWTIDTTPPDTAITSQPTDSTNATSAIFSFSSSKEKSKFQCSLDGGIYTACTVTQAYTGLVDGTHILSVRAMDAAANIDPEPASFTWTVDTTPPRTTIAVRPGDPTNSTSASFVFSSTKTGSKFQCKLDEGAFAACADAQNYAGLADGRHTLSVVATDTLGNTEPMPTSYAWTIDITPPLAMITQRPADPTNSTSAHFVLSSTKTGSKFQCKLDDGAFAACADAQNYEGLAAGPHTFTVQATDAVGNVDPRPQVFTWTIDVTPPVTTITNKPHTWTNSTAAGFGFASDKKGSSFQCSLDGRAYSACTSTQTYTGLIAGSHTFSARATDAVGNAELTPATHTWTIDSTPFGTVITSQTPTLSHSDVAAFTFASKKENTTFQCKLDKGSYAACTSPVTYTGLTEDNHTFFVKAIDPIGNEETIPAEYTWAVELPPIAQTPAGFTYKGGSYITVRKTVKLTIAASSSRGVTGYLVSESSTTPDLESPDWVTFHPVKDFSRKVSYTMKGGGGLKKIYIWFKDSEDNVSAPAINTIYLFNAGYVVTVFVILQVAALVVL